MNRTITVKSTGKVSVKPDYISINLKLAAKDCDYGKTMNLAEKQLEELRKSLEKAGVNRDGLKTCDFNVNAEYKSVNDKRGGYSREFDGYCCRHSLKVEFGLDMKKLGAVLGSVSSCTAKPEFKIKFTVKDKDAVAEKLLESAAAEARKKAETLCKASEVKLGQLISIDYNRVELDVYSPTVYSAVDSGAVRCANIEIEPENIDLTDAVTFVWEID